MFRTVFACATAALLIGTMPARADLAKLSATFDSMLQNTVFTVTNDSTAAEAVALTTSLGPTTFIGLPNLAAGASETYVFSQIAGGFENDPASAGLPDTTSYALLIGPNGGPLVDSSAAFSPVANLTGGDVDFLGNNCNGFSGGPGTFSGTCGGTDALSGIVATVPEPSALTLLLPGLAMLGVALRLGKGAARS